MAGNFRLQLSDFKLLTARRSKSWSAKRLRFTLTWAIDLDPVNPALNDVAEEIRQRQSGNLAHVTNKGELVWASPQARSGAWYNNIIENNPGLYRRVLAALSKTEAVKELYEELPEFVEPSKETIDVT